jgi:NAD-dependent dihydropyrimidine dehydrogenase PreA subunit
VEGKTQYYIDTDLCLDHRACVAVCPVAAIEPGVGSSGGEESE